MKSELRTDIVTLRPVQISDAIDLHTLRSNPVVNKFIERDVPKTLTDTEAFIQNKVLSQPNPYLFTIRTIQNFEFAGTICLWNINWENKYAEVGYELLPDFQGKGLMSSALSEIIRFGFKELDLETIGAFTHHENIASRKLLEKSNFKLVLSKTDHNPNHVVYCLKRTSS